MILARAPRRVGLIEFQLLTGFVVALPGFIKRHGWEYAQCKGLAFAVVTIVVAPVFTGLIHEQVQASTIGQFEWFFGEFCLLHRKGFQCVVQDSTFRRWVRDTTIRRRFRCTPLESIVHADASALRV